MTVDIVPFGGEHLDAAAELVAARQVRLRSEEPGLPERWIDPAEARTLLEPLLDRGDASGHAALDDGRLVGFLVGEVRRGGSFDASGWVELAGHAVEPEHVDVARDLYAAWSEHLIHGLGVLRHLVNVPAGEPALVETWHQLNFGQMHAYGLRPSDPADLGPSAPDLRIRDATPQDVALMEATSELIWREQLGPPSWSPISADQIASLRGEYVEELDEEEDRIWVAEDADSGEALGVSISYRLDPDLDVPDANMKLASTTTFAAARRRGVARALLRTVLQNAMSEGAGWVVTDWRTSSLLASRAWTGMGFRRTRLRLERRIDPAVVRPE